MTEQEQTASNENAGPADNSAATSVKKGTGLIALVILLSLTWYLVADRFTPYTSQARVQGYVIGVAPKVAGVVTEVWSVTTRRYRPISACSRSIRRSTKLLWARRRRTWTMLSAR
jgi:hypothetical protein